MKKILIHREDTAEAVVQKILAHPEPEVAIVIPTHSALRDSVGHFYLIKREAAAHGVEVSVESVDETVLALAAAAGLKGDHPFFQRQESRALSDIIPTARPPASPPREEPEPASEAVRESKGEPPTERREDEWQETPIETPSAQPFPLRRRKLLVALLLVALSVGGGTWALGTLFARAQVEIRFKKVPWQHEGVLVAGRDLATLDAERSAIPAQVFREQRNMTQLFPASGKAQVSEKAKGRLTIYNAYSSEPQVLVTSTRFVTGDGKIFRLDGQVLVPGAQVKDGTIVPSSIEAGVTADKAGPEYNVGPTEKFTIPGFKGSPKYSGFSGALREGAKGGFLGTKAVPTPDDVARAKEKVTEVLRASLEQNFGTTRPGGFVVLDDAKEVTVTKLTAKPETDEQGNFGVFGEAHLRAVGFRETDVASLLRALAQKEHGAITLTQNSFEYRDAKLNFDRGEIIVTLAATSTLVPAFSPEEFKTKAVGQSLANVRSLILGLPGVSDAKVSLWPFWLGRLPENPKRVQVVAD